MRALALAAVALPLLLAGCVGGDDPPAREPAATPEEACEARGLGDTSCGTFCALHPVACGIPAPTPAPYPTFPLPTPALATPSLPGPLAPALNGTAPEVAPPDVCALTSTLPECPQL